MHYIPMGPKSYVNLPRDGGVAYHAQESWVLNETIRVSPTIYNKLPSLTPPQSNILFEAPFDQERYDKGELPLDPQQKPI